MTKLSDILSLVSSWFICCVSSSSIPSRCSWIAASSSSSLLIDVNDSLKIISDVSMSVGWQFVVSVGWQYSIIGSLSLEFFYDFFNLRFIFWNKLTRDISKYTKIISSIISLGQLSRVQFKISIIWVKKLNWNFSCSDFVSCWFFASVIIRIFSLKVDFSCRFLQFSIFVSIFAVRILWLFHLFDYLTRLITLTDRQIVPAHGLIQQRGRHWHYDIVLFEKNDKNIDEIYHHEFAWKSCSK